MSTVLLSVVLVVSAVVLAMAHAVPAEAHHNEKVVFYQNSNAHYFHNQDEFLQLDTNTRPDGIAYHDGTFYIVDPASGEVVKYNATTGNKLIVDGSTDKFSVVNTDLPSNKRAGYGLAVYDNLLYMVNFDNAVTPTHNRIYAYYLNGTYTGTYINLHSDNINQYALAIYNGSAYVTDDPVNGSPKIYVYNINDGSYERSFDTAVSHAHRKNTSPSGMTMVGDVLYVLDDNRHIFRYNPTTGSPIYTTGNDSARNDFNNEPCAPTGTSCTYTGLVVVDDTLYVLADRNNKNDMLRTFTLRMPPVFDSPANGSIHSVDKGDSFTLNVDASDPNSGDTLTYTLEQGPTGAQVNRTTGAVTWNTADHDAGRYQFTIRANDGSSISGNDGSSSHTTNLSFTVHSYIRPTITINGANSVSVPHDTTYTDAGATCTDAVDGQLNVTYSSDVDTTTAGTYTVTYTCTNSNGDVVTTSKTVTVLPSEKHNCRGHH